MSGEGLARRPPLAVVKAEQQQSAAEVKAQLRAAREKAAESLKALEQRLGRAAQWREAVRRHPVLTLGGAFVVGYLAGRLFFRR